jgi:hypothetical protein
MPGVAALACNHRHTSASTEIHDTGTGTAERDPKTPENPLSSRQEGRLSGQRGFNQKLRLRALSLLWGA